MRAMTSDDLHDIAEAVRRVQIERALDRGDHDAIIAEAFDAGKAGVKVDERGLIAVDKQMRTNVPHIFAIGDVVGQPMLAHKATHEGKQHYDH